MLSNWLASVCEAIFVKSYASALSASVAVSGMVPSTSAAADSEEGPQ